MQGNDSMSMLRGLLLTTMSNDNAARKATENTISGMEDMPGFTLELLKLVSSLSTSTNPEDIAIRQAGAAIFKNVIRRRWVVDEDNSDFSAIPDSDRDTIKVNLVDLMCSSPKAVQKQLGEAVSIIAKQDFPAKWEHLPSQLLGKLQTQDIYIINGVMSTINSLLKRYRFGMQTNDLMRELVFCLSAFQEPLLTMYKAMTGAAIANNSNKQQLELIMETVYQMTRCFLSLNNQDLPEYFEDHMQEWMDEFEKYFTLSNPLLVDDSEEDEPGVLERVRAAIIENLNLYASKYEEEFAPYLPKFTQYIWKLLVDVNTMPKYDLLVTQAIKFLIAVSSKQMYSYLFTDQVLEDIIKNIVVKNLMVTDRDMELFEDNPFDYIRKDMEGSDLETRRRCAMELVRALLKLFNRKTSELCTTYVHELLRPYNENPAANWKYKDAAVHLILSVSILTTSVAQGAQELNPNVNMLELFNAHILPELVDTSSINNRPIVKADVIKLVCLFRNHLDVQQLATVILPLLVKYINAQHTVIQTYAAIGIEKFLVLKYKADGNTKPSLKLTKQHVTPYLQELFGNLFNVIENNEDSAENEYVLKCTMRVLIVIGADMLSALELISNKLTALLARVCKNPINPQFNHYLFECIAIMIRTGCDDTVEGSQLTKQLIGDNCAKFEQLLFPPFTLVLTQDVTEFVPYVFQILAQLLFYRPVEIYGMGLSEAYRSLFAPLLSPALWERKGNIPALMELMQSYMVKGMNDLIAGNYLMGILGIFQKLLSLKSSEVHAFTLMNLLVRYNAVATIQQQIPTIFQLILNRMMSNKSPKFYKLVIHFFCVFANNYGGSMLASVLDSIQPNLLIMVITQVFTPHIKYICSTIDLTSGLEIILGCHSLLCKDVDSIPTLKENTSNCFMALLKNMICVVNSTSKLVSGKPTNAYLNLLGVNDDDDSTVLGGQDFDNAYSKLQYANVTVPQQIIVNGSNIAPANCTNSNGLFAFCCSIWSNGLNNVLQTHLSLKAGIAPGNGFTEQDLQTLRSYQVNV